MSSRSLRTILVCASACLLVAACAKKSEGTIEAGDDTEAIASTSHVSRIDQMLYAPITSSVPTEAASSVAAAQWWPAGCASRSKDADNPNVVHVHLNDCSGPFGLRHHTGDITVVFSNVDGTLHAQATSLNMTVNGHEVTYSRDADITVDAGTRTIKSTGAWTRVNDRGDTVSHTSALTTVLDTRDGCRTTNGTAQTDVARREIDSTITDYKICRRADGTDTCPTGEVTHARKVSGDTVTIAFDGSNEAEVTGPKGNTVQVGLVCTP